LADSAATDPPPSRERAPEIVFESAAHRLLPALAVSGLIVLAPLPFGSAHGWSLWAVQAIALCAAGLLACFEGGARAKRALGPLLLPAAFFGSALLLQLVPLPLGLLGWVSPTVAKLYAQMVDSPERWFAASVNPHASFISVIRLVAYGAAFVVVATAPLPGRRSLFHWSILLSGAIAAAIAWAHRIQGWDTRLFGEFAAFQAIAPTPRLHWPLLNPNHLAAMLNVAWLVALGAFLSPGLLGARAIARESQVHRTIALFAMLLSASASYATHSRGGLAAGAAGLGLLVILWPASEGSARRLVVGARVAVTVVVVAGIGWLLAKAFIGIDQTTVLASLQRQDATLQVRLEVFRQGLGMLRDFALFGTGLGTWGDAFPRYQAYPLLFAAVTHAHCDILEWLSDLGIVGFSILGWAAVVFVREPIASRDDESLRRHAVLTAAFGSLLVHATGDFALRVPAVGFIGAALLGLLWRERRSAAEEAARPAPSFGRGIGAFDALAVAASVAALVYVASWEWRDERLLARLTARETVAPPRAVDWKVLEAVSRRRAASGESPLDPAIDAVWSAPLSARAHHALAYGYQSDLMRERELRRAVACEPSTRFWRLEHALSLAALGRFMLARKEIEEGFYFDPQFGDEGWLRFQDPIDRSWPFLEAALRGVRRRTLQSPETAAEARRFEALRLLLVETYERRRDGR